MDDFDLVEVEPIIENNLLNQDTNIEDPFVISDTNSSSNVLQPVENHQASSNDQNEDMIVNDSIENQENQPIRNDQNLNEINHTAESFPESNVIDLEHINKEQVTTADNLGQSLESLEVNLKVVETEGIQITVEKQVTQTKEALENEPKKSESPKNDKQTSVVNTNNRVQSLPLQSILSMRPFSTSKISIQKLPKNRPNTSITAAKNEDSSKNVNRIEDDIENKPISNGVTKAKKSINCTNSNDNKVRYRQVKIIKMIRQTTTFTFREEFNPETNDFQTMTLLSTKKTKEMDSESTECSLISKKNYLEEEAEYFKQLDGDNERNFTSNSSADTSLSDENTFLTNQYPIKSKQNEPKTITTTKLLNKKRAKSRDSNSEDSENEQSREKRPNRQSSANKNTANTNKKNNSNTQNTISKTFQSSKSITNSRPSRKTALSKRDLNSYSASENGSVTGSKLVPSVYTISRASSVASLSPSIDSSVFENETNSKNKTTQQNKPKNLDKINVNLDKIDSVAKNKLLNNDIRVSLRRLTYDEMANANLVYKSEECDTNSSDCDDTLINANTISQQQRNISGSFGTPTNIVRNCSVRISRVNCSNENVDNQNN